MKQQPDLMNLFIDALADMNSSEHQIIQALPKLSKLATSVDLKNALDNYLKETEIQVTRIEKTLTLLSIPARKQRCAGMAGIVSETDNLVKRLEKSPLLDAAIVSCVQKVKHYEIASYGTLRAFAKQLGLANEIVDLLQETLDEEIAANDKLTTIAEGGIFISGVNKAASAATPEPQKPKKRQDT